MFHILFCENVHTASKDAFGINSIGHNTFHVAYVCGNIHRKNCNIGLLLEEKASIIIYKTRIA